MGDGNCYPPLLDIGLHPMSTQEIRELCVSDGRFVLSGTRSRIMDNLETLIEALRWIGICGYLWIDGSFLTEKIDPADVDLLLYLEDDAVQAFTSQQKSDVDWLLENAEIHKDYDCDSHVHVSFPVEHPSHSFGEYMHAYFLRLFGFDEFYQMKGIAVVTL
jgi:hypothetical protein